ncbi:tRNA pseudouridine(55) synthase TruB [bacterium]|nr:tRNA pseudouridine(55) synthase TruB [bacterium]MBR1620316.1 tRNA pseudouridine(55) synthase TruB [bacterium]
MTSFDVVAILRKITHIKQIGHSGTLDPFATGVLPVCIGKSTRLIEYLDDDKEYIATVKFGADTDTYDLEGQILKTYETKISKSQLEMVLDDFKGEIEQYPPIYSAIKVNGKKLYEYARKGQEVEIKPRKVYISKIEILEFDEQNQIAKIIIGCSKGTYIRSIAHDVGQKLNCGGYLIALERTKAGKFTIENAIKLDDIKNENDINAHLINPIDVLSGKKYILNENEKIKVMHGIALNLREQKQITEFCDSIVFLVYGGKIIAVGQINDKEIKIKKVFEVL